MENPTRTTHPMVIVAATAVTIASLVAIASFAGWLPGKNTGEAAPTEQATTVPAQPETAPENVANEPAAMQVATPGENAESPAKPPPAPKTTTKKSAKGADYALQSNSGRSGNGSTHVSNDGVYEESGQPQTQPAYASTCRECGTVESIREVKHEGQSTGLGAIGGGVLGGLLGNQVGGGKGKTVGAVVGAVGGAYAGNAVEKNVRSTKSYEITVRFDDGNTRVFSEAQPPALQYGDRVRLHNGQLSRM